ncbi:centromere protein C [Silene latifolia]|uniref:centromere protein C n=1 Tax=Silene latifolia TaxID=37657 RepID=UPI003D76F56A
MSNAESAVDNDPLADYSFYTLGTTSLFRSVPNTNFGSPLSLFKHLFLRNPDSLLDQVKTILESVDHVESDKSMGPVSEDNSNAPGEDNSKAPGVVNDKKPRERRPGLGLTPAKFKMKPMTSQPDPCPEPTLDITKITDAEELFAAFERMENAKREIRRLKGLPLEDIDQNSAFLERRQRRANRVGRKAVYKHRTYSLTGVPDNDESLKSTQEANDHNIIRPTLEDTIPETNAVIFSPQTRVSDDKPAMSSKVSELDELLSYDYEGLDEDGVQNFLAEKLNVKLVDISEPSLPDMPAVRRREYASFLKPLPDVEDSLLRVTDSSKAGGSKPLNFSTQYWKSKSLNIQVSPPLSKSPLASISTLNKRISRLTPLKDPFSPEDIVSSPDECYFPQPQNKKQDDQIITSSPAKEVINECVTSPCSPVNSTNPNIEYDERLDGVGHSDQLMTSKDSHVFEKASVCGEEDIGVSGEKLLFEERIDETRETSHSGIGENLFDLTSPTDGEDNPAVFGEASLASARKDVDMTTAPIEEDQMAASPKSGGKEAFNEVSAVEVNVNEGDVEMAEALNTQYISMIKPSKETVGSLNSKLKETEKSTSVSQENINVETVNKARKGKAKSKATVLKDKHEETEKTALETIIEETVNKSRTGKARSNATDLMEPKNKKKKVEGKIDRQLLILNEAGTKWEEGVRRSTRIRMRPLEFWRGERFLYGRVHESVVSVIGVKYASPAKNSEERFVKVKSFVPDEYKNLVDLASSY